MLDADVTWDVLPSVINRNVGCCMLDVGVGCCLGLGCLLWFVLWLLLVASVLGVRVRVSVKCEVRMCKWWTVGLGLALFSARVVGYGPCMRLGSESEIGSGGGCVIM